MRSALLGSLFQTGFNVLLYAFLVRLLPVEQMRIWVLWQTVIVFADMARQGFVYNSTVRFWVANPDHRGSISGASLLLSLVVSGLAGGVVLGVSFPLAVVWNAPELPVLAAFYLPFGLLFGLVRWLEMLLIARENFHAPARSGAIFGGGSLLGVVCLAWATGPISLSGVVQIQTLAAALTIFYLLKRHGWPAGLTFKCANWFKKLAQYGQFSAGTGLFSMLFSKADVLILGTLLPGPAVVLYDAAARLWQYLDLPMNGVSQVFYPKLSRAFGLGDRAEAGRLFQSAVGQLLAMMAPLAVVFLLAAPLLVGLLCGEKYVAAAPLLQILVLASVAKPWGRIGGIALDASGRAAANFGLLLVNAGLNIGLNFGLISLLGIWGAALATSLSVWMSVFFQQWWLRRHFPVSQLAIFGECREALLGGGLYRKLIFNR